MATRSSGDGAERRRRPEDGDGDRGCDHEPATEPAHRPGEVRRRRHHDRRRECEAQGGVPRRGFRRPHGVPHVRPRPLDDALDDQPHHGRDHRCDDEVTHDRAAAADDGGDEQCRCPDQQDVGQDLPHSREEAWEAGEEALEGAEEARWREGGEAGRHEQRHRPDQHGHVAGAPGARLVGGRGEEPEARAEPRSRGDRHDSHVELGAVCLGIRDWSRPGTDRAQFGAIRARWASPGRAGCRAGTRRRTARSTPRG